MNEQGLNASHDIFGGLHGAEAIDQLEGGGSPGASVFFEGSIDRNAETTLVDPRQLVTCYLRPNRQYSMVVDPMALMTAQAQGYKVDRSDPVKPTAHFIPGKAYRVSKQTFAANRAVLCTANEYAILRAQERSLAHQDVTKQVQAMRSHQLQVSRQTMTADQIAKEEELRKRAAADEGAIAAAERLQQQAIDGKKHEEAQAADAARDSLLGTMSAEQLEAHCATTLADADIVSARFGERGRAQVMQAAQEEADALRLRWSQLHPTTRDEPASGGNSLADRAKKLRGLLESGVITQPEFDRQLAQMVSE